MFVVTNQALLFIGKDGEKFRVPNGRGDRPYSGLLKDGPGKQRGIAAGEKAVREGPKDFVKEVGK